MTKETPDAPHNNVIHLQKRAKSKSLREQISEDISLSIAAHFREQNEVVRATNNQLSAQVQRLMTGIDRLIGEMDGVRTGKKEEAFARVGSLDESVDLPTVAAEAALLYTFTAAEIGTQLDGLRASQVGLLLSKKGLNWAGDGDYQELSRHKKPSQTRFWHFDVPKRLHKILLENQPAKYGITDKTILTLFRNWNANQVNLCRLAALDGTTPSH